MNPCYLDHNATTPLDPRVLEAIVEVLASHHGNPSSLHSFGQKARGLMEDARAEVAALLGASTGDVVFTGSGTEADNLALRGFAGWRPQGRQKIVHGALEHHAVLNTARALAEEGVSVVSVKAESKGTIDLEDLERKVDDETAVVAVMLANNETGVIQPLEEVVRIARRRGAHVHCDAVQAIGKIGVDVKALDVDTLALSAHKFSGPKGVGALYVRRGLKLKALVRGGSQERNRRAGTENVPGIVGLGRAAAIARAEGPSESRRVLALRDLLEAALLAIPGSRRNGDEPRISNTTNISFEGLSAETLLMALDLAGIAVSTGAACAAGAIEPSHVLRAMGLPLTRVEGSLRFSLGRGNTIEDVSRAAAATAAAVEHQRGLVGARA